MRPVQYLTRIKDLAFSIEDQNRSRMIYLLKGTKDISIIINGVRINQRNNDVFFIEQFFSEETKRNKKKWFVQYCWCRLPRSLSSSSSLKTRHYDTNDRKQ